MGVNYDWDSENKPHSCVIEKLVYIPSVDAVSYGPERSVGLVERAEALRDRAALRGM